MLQRKPAGKTAWVTSAPPRWDLTSFFPSIESPEFVASIAAFSTGVQELRALYDGHNVGANAGSTPDAATVDAFEEIVGATNALMAELRLLEGYAECVVAADARDEPALAARSRLAMTAAPLAAKHPAKARACRRRHSRPGRAGPR